MNRVEHLTEELLERLLESSDISDYLDSQAVVERELPDYLFALMKAHNLKRADVVRGSGVNATVVYDIFAGKSKPGRDHAIMIAFGLECDLRRPRGCCVSPEWRNCGASSAATPSSSGASTRRSTVWPPTMSCAVWGAPAVADELSSGFVRVFASDMMRSRQYHQRYH